MNNKKKQTVAVAMATALGVSAMMSPVAVHAQEEDPATAITQEDNQQDSTQETKLQDETPVSEQGLPANEIPRLPKTGEVAVDKANFPDDKFRQYVSDNFDDNNDDVLSTVELDNATTIQLYGEKNIKNIQGIQYLKNIDFISCDETQIETIDVSEKKKLKSLFCSDIPTLTSLNVDGADALVQLQCYSTGITELNVSPKMY